MMMMMMMMTTTCLCRLVGWSVGRSRGETKNWCVCVCVTTLNAQERTIARFICLADPVLGRRPMYNNDDDDPKTTPR